MRIELTETLWDTLNPEKQEDGTAWMFTDDHYFVMGFNFEEKVFFYHNPLINPMLMPIDPWFKTAGILDITPEKIVWEGYNDNMILYEQPKKSNIIQFPRK